MRSMNATESVSVQSRTILLTSLLQGSKEIEDNLENLITPLAELNLSMQKSSAHNSRDEAERRKELTRFLAHPYRLIESS